jgi:uncharacterized RDD family membrane protein YckC
MNGWQVFVEIAGRPPVELKPGESIIGRSRTAQVQVPDSTVSRQHARLLFGALGEVLVEDLGSSNGTIVNGARVEGRHKLVDGDRILVGDVELRLRVVAPVAPSEATVRMVLPPLGAPPAIPLPQPAPSMSPAPAFAAPAPMPLTAAPSPLSLPLQTPPPPIAPPPVSSSPVAPPPMAPPPMAPPIAPPLAAPPPIAVAPQAIPNYTVPIAPPPLPPRSFDPPLRIEAPAQPPIVVAPPPAPVRPPTPPSPPAAPPARPQAPPAHAALPAVSPRTGAARGAELPSVTVIDRIPIPQVTPEVIRASKLARAAPAGFWVRLLALVLDAALVGLVIVVIGVALLFIPDIVPRAILQIAFAAIASALSIAYPLVFWATQGATPGKKFLGLTVVTPATRSTAGGIGWGPAILRSIGYLLSGALLGFGFLLVAFTSQKQGLHDLIASTRVVRVR